MATGSGEPRIIVDAMGGDDAPGPVIDGALAAARHFDLGVVLVGPTARLCDEVAARGGIEPERLRLVDADGAVEMGESPSHALRAKRNASIRVAADVVARGEEIGRAHV